MIVFGRRGLLGARIVLYVLLLVPFLTLTKSQSHAQGHDSERRSHQDFDSPAQGLLTILRSCRGRTVAHGTALCERGERPEAQKPNQQDNATPYRMGLSRLHRAFDRRSHLTPNERMRNASGKKTIIMARQNTSAHMVRYFIRTASYFMCMK